MRNIFLKNRSDENKIKHNKQRNLCVKILRKTKREYYQNLIVENVCDNKSFWKVVKPLLSNKIMSSEKITVSQLGFFMYVKQLAWGKITPPE